MNKRFSVMSRPNLTRDAFTMIELLVGVAILLILIGLVVPTLKGLQQKARAASCANNLRQIFTAFSLYLGENNQTIFWKGPRGIGLDGMDWYVYGGRETGNAYTQQEDLFNRIQPRPLNLYLNNLAVFRCPNDLIKFSTTQGNTLFDLAGTSYNFNATGPYIQITQADTMGLSGVNLGRVANPSQMVLFYEGSFVKGAGQWHGIRENVCFLDGHIEALTRQELNTKLARTVVPEEEIE